MGLFFKWIKQILRIKHFFGRSDNVVNVVKTKSGSPSAFMCWGGAIVRKES